MTISIGLCTPSNLWSLSLEARANMLSQMTDIGVEYIYMADHVSFRNGNGADGLIECAALSQLHPTIGVMVSIYLLPLRHPLPVARQLASIAQIAPGRMRFGIGVGGDDRHEVEVCGVDPSTRGARTNEQLQILRALLAGETIDFDGDHFTIEQALIRPTPKSPIPFIVGGRSNAALKRTARFGDGWVGVWCSDRRYAEAVALIEEAREAAGRPPVAWQHGYQPWVGVDQNEDRARNVVKTAMEKFYSVPFEKFERYTPYGTPARVAEALAPYAAAGCQYFNLKVVTEHPEEEVELAGEVIKELQALTA